EPGPGVDLGLLADRLAGARLPDHGRPRPGHRAPGARAGRRAGPGRQRRRPARRDGGAGRGAAGGPGRRAREPRPAAVGRPDAAGAGRMRQLVAVLALIAVATAGVLAVAAYRASRP